ncbi:MAG: WD40/YVTN/BNR-like repeat-containing protein [Sulfobacillus sp.]
MSMHPVRWSAVACTLLVLSACGSVASPSPSRPVTQTSRSVRPPAKTPELAAVTMLSPTVSLAGGLGVILRTSNDGRSWVPVAYPSGSVSSFDQVSAQLVFALTDHALYESQDAGATWRAVNPKAQFSQVVFLNASRGFGLRLGVSPMTPGPVVVTANGGASWSPLSIPFHAVSMCFTSNRTGFALGAPSAATQGTVALGTLYTTGDGGASWQRLNTVPGNWLSGQLHCAASGLWMELYGQAGMSQQSYDIFRSTNGGQTWNAVAVDSTAGGGPAPGNPHGAAQAPGSSPVTMVAVGRQSAYVLGSCEACGNGGTVFFGSTQDGGHSFTSSATAMAGLSGMSPIGMSFANAETGMIVAYPSPGLSLILTSQDAGQTWQVASRLVSPNPVGGISFVSSQIGFGLATATDARAVLKTTDGGRTWHQVGQMPAVTPGSGSGAPFTGNASAFSLAFVSASTGFGAGVNGALSETRNGGRSWQPVAAMAQAGQLNAIAFASPQAGCASMFSPAGASVLWATRDGGRHWTQLAENSPLVMFALTWGYPMLACAAALANPGFETGLPAWSQGTYGLLAAVPGDQAAIALAFTGAPSAPNGQLLSATVGSRSWSSQALPTGRFNAFSFSFLSLRQGFLTTANGRLFETTDGGHTWIELP